MPIVPTIPTIEHCAVSLPLYASHLGIGECGLFGINAPYDTGTCKSIWTFDNRKMIAHYLCMAQGEIENLLGYPLSVKWFTAEPHLAMLGRQYRTKWKKVIAGGAMAVSVVADSAAVDDTGDPYIIGPVPTTVTDINEIHVYHEDSDQEIIPSSIIIAGGLLTIEVPECRMVLPDYWINPAVGWNLTDAVFATTVDIKRVYNDTSTQAKFNKVLCNCAGNLCTDEYLDGCINVIDHDLGLVAAYPASYAAGAWTSTVRMCTHYKAVDLNYCAGLNTLTSEFLDAIIRLAHSRLPHPPCGCDPIKDFWERDRNIPDVMTAEREACLFGVSDGAWAAWRIINNPGLRIMRASVL